MISIHNHCKTILAWKVFELPKFGIFCDGLLGNIIGIEKLHTAVILLFVRFTPCQLVPVCSSQGVEGRCIPLGQVVQIAVPFPLLKQFKY